MSALVCNCARTQFEFIPATAVTIHRVQGATLSGEVHLLLNKEIFAYGQVSCSYIALTHTRMRYGSVAPTQTLFRHNHN